jgi:hypothetical protein
MIKDEDTAYGEWRQRKLDEKFMQDSLNEPRFGGALKKADWIQRSVNHDPHPEVPFADELLYIDKRVVWACVVAAVIVFVLLGTGVL